MLPEPGIRTFVLIPLLVNILLFGGAIAVLFSQFDGWVNYLISSVLPDWEWLDFLRYLLWPLMALLVLVVVYYSFTIVANLIAAPFNGFLSEQVERKLRGETGGPDGLAEALKLIPRTIGRELAKLGYYLPRLIFLLLLSFVPVIGMVAPILLLLFGAWMLAIQYCDYPMDNNRVSFKDMRLRLKQERMTALGFGGLMQLGMLIPILNLILMPAAVVGATIYWVEKHHGSIDASY